jgi:SPP1 gp7 family putative phage head morphogenesis protein
MSKNTFTDLVTKNQVYLEKLKAQQVIVFDQVHGEIESAITEVLGALEVESLDKLTKAQLSGTLNALRTTQGEVQLAALADLTTQLQGTAGFQAAFEQTMLDSVLKKGNSKIKMVNVSANKAYQHALDHPVAGTGALMEPFMKSWSESTLGAVEGAVRDGWAQGKTVPQVMQQIRGTKAAMYKDGILTTSRREAAAMVRTSTQHVAQSARMATWGANGDLIKGYEILATLDGRTSTVCRALDGEKFDLGKGPVPPLHVNCRSTTIPTLGPEWDFLDEGATRSSLNGYVPADTTYYEWLKGQDPAFIKDAIGAGNATLLTSGKLTAREFKDLSLGKNFEPMTLKQMAEKSPQVFKDTGLEKYIPDGAFEKAQQAAEETAKKTAFANKMQESKAAAAAMKLEQAAAKEAAEKLAAEQAALAAEQAQLAAEKAAFAQKMQEAKAAAAAKKVQTQELVTTASANKPLSQAQLDFLDTLTSKEKQAYKDAVEVQIAANKAAFAQKMKDAKAAAKANGTSTVGEKVPATPSTAELSQSQAEQVTGMKVGSPMWNGQVNLYDKDGKLIQLFKSKADAVSFMKSEATKLAAGGNPAPVVAKAAATPNGSGVVNSGKITPSSKPVAKPYTSTDFQWNVDVAKSKVATGSKFYTDPNVLNAGSMKPYSSLKYELDNGAISQAEHDYILAVKEHAKNKAGIAYGPISQVAPTSAGYNPHSGYSSAGSSGAVDTLTHKKVVYSSATHSDFEAKWPSHRADQASNAAVTKYTGSSYTSINSQLRSGSAGGQSATIKDIRNWFASAPLVKDNMIVYRGIRLRDGETWDSVFKLGGKYQDKAFISSSAVKGNNFDGFQLKILVPKGSAGVAKVKHLSHYGSENEVLFNSGQFEVVESTPNGATLRYLGPAK